MTASKCWPLRGAERRELSLDEALSDPLIRARLMALVPKLLAWHRWCYAARDPFGTGLASIIHPWESGMDNSPVWDDALSAVEPGPSVAELRKDTSFTAATHRPTGPEYDRYINLVIMFRGNGYRADRLYHLSPFRIADIGGSALIPAVQRLENALNELERRQPGFQFHVTGTFPAVARICVSAPSKLRLRMILITPVIASEP